MYKIIDVSSWQGKIDWGTASGEIDGCIIRAGFGTHTIDDQMLNNVHGCEANGVPYGFYWFSYALTPEEAREEAKTFLSVIGGYKPTLPLYFDFEYDSVRYASGVGVNVTHDLLVEMASAFCEEVEKAGYYVGIYANEDYYSRFYGENIFNKYDLWYALYNGEKDLSNKPRECHIWQYSSKGSINGINEPVDLNVAYIDFPKLITENGLNKTSIKWVCPNKCPYCQNCNA